MTVLCTGARGFVGRHCLPLLRRSGYEVCAVTSGPVPNDHDVDWRSADLLNADARRALIADVRPTYLLHLAWVTTPGLYWTSPSNLRWAAATMELVESFVACGGTKAVFAGSCAEYEWHGARYSEMSTPLRPATLYGACKQATQIAVQAFAAQRQLQTAWGRIFFTFGPWESPNRLVSSVIGRLLTGRPALCSEGLQARDFLAVDEVASAFVALLASDVQGAVNIASGESRPIREVVQYLARRLDAESLVRFGAKPAPDEPMEMSADVTRLANEVGWRPTRPIDESLDRTIDWWREQLSSGAIEPSVFA